MFVAAAEETQDNLVGGRGDAYCGILNASYNLALRNIKAYIPEYPVGTATEVADMIKEFIPVARAVIGLNNLKVISFGPRPQDFLACNAPIKQLYNLGVEIEENSELDLYAAFNEHKNDARIPEVVADMERSLVTATRCPVSCPDLHSLRSHCLTGWKHIREAESTLYSPTSAGPHSRHSSAVFPAM